MSRLKPNMTRSLFEALGGNINNLEFRFSDYVGDMIIWNPVIGVLGDRVNWIVVNDVQFASWEGGLLCVEILHADRDGIDEGVLGGLDKKGCVDKMQEILEKRDVRW